MITEGEKRKFVGTLVRMVVSKRSMSRRRHPL